MNPTFITRYYPTSDIRFSFYHFEPFTTHLGLPIQLFSYQHMLNTRESFSNGPLEFDAERFLKCELSF